ncbi:MAG: 16S rRNA (cytosine(1402)-N(4))-methyltransferase RsmH [Oscillospiraceae bacterium]|nr:16S rRNA (cytosine(1402)-N(4))-methyltransferase RsmH [Oscillospiraceae bacterium]
MEFTHIPVLLEETIEGLAIRPDGIYVDGTVGGAGHAKEIASRLGKNGLLIGLDRDPDAVAVATKRLQNFPAKVVHSNYSEMRNVLDNLQIAQVDGILLDLGVSSYQLDNAERGFSYHTNAKLDMRMNQDGLSAYDVINTWDKQTLCKILWEYGEEKFAERIAERVICAREHAPIQTTGELAELVRQAVPQKYRREKNPCKKTFQAIRIAVNDEFGHLRIGLESAFHCLKSGGRLAVITFHSLEDRIVKQQFASWCKGCICPPDFPQCVCGRKPKAKLLIRKPMTAKQSELEQNYRSHSAKLRLLEKERG